MKTPTTQTSTSPAVRDAATMPMCVGTGFADYRNLNRCENAADGFYKLESVKAHGPTYTNMPLCEKCILKLGGLWKISGQAESDENSSSMVVPSAVAPHLPDTAAPTEIQFLRDAFSVCQRASNETLDPSGEISQKEIEAGCPSFSDFGVIGIVETLHYEYRLAVEEQVADADDDWEELGKALDEARGVMR